MSRFDMHMAFRGYDRVIESLHRVCKFLDGCSLKGELYYRPRCGVFVQADCCGKNNLSGETVIPTFTCNFIVNASDAERRMSEIVDIVKARDSVLEQNFLRVRCEGQFPILKFNPMLERIDEIADRPKDFPKNVSGEQYFDVHIHILGLTADNTLEKWAAVAKIGIDLGMPIIVNSLKIETGIIRPFYTKRWYDTTLNDAIASLGKVYHQMYQQLITIGLVPVLIPEFEVTMNDPDCQVTDQGWMPTSFCKFDFNDNHTLIPTSVRYAINRKAN